MDTSAPSAPAQGAPPPPSGGASEQQPPLGGGAFSFLILALPLLLIFLMTRSQNKKQKQLEENLKAGDRVFTQGGIIGKIVEINPNSARAKIEIAPGVNVQILKSSIQGADAGDAPADAKAADKAKEKPQDKKS